MFTPNSTNYLYITPLIVAVPPTLAAIIIAFHLIDIQSTAEAVLKGISVGIGLAVAELAIASSVYYISSSKQKN